MFRKAHLGHGLDPVLQIGWHYLLNYQYYVIGRGIVQHLPYGPLRVGGQEKIRPGFVAISRYLHGCSFSGVIIRYLCPVVSLREQIESLEYSVIRPDG
jgi:hypothetical protein